MLFETYNSTCRRGERWRSSVIWLALGVAAVRQREQRFESHDDGDVDVRRQCNVVDVADDVDVDDADDAARAQSAERRRADGVRC